MIRDFRLEDLPIIWAINQQNVPAVGEETMSDLAEIAQLSSIALVAEVDTMVVGFCLVLPPGTTYDSPNYRYFSDRFSDFIYLDRVAITSAHQGMSLGTEMYNEVERRSSSQWFTLEVNVVPPNEGSMRFHRRQGFVEVEQKETRPGKVVSLMAKRLGARSDTVWGHD